MMQDRALRLEIVGLFLTLPLANTLTIDVGFPLTIAHMFVALLAATTLWRLAHGASWHSWLPAALFVTFCVVYLVSAAANLIPGVQEFPWATGRNAPGIRSVLKALWLLVNVAGALVIVNALRQTRTEGQAILALAVGAVAASIYALYQVVGQSHGFYIPVLPGTDFIAGTSSIWIIPRAKSTFLEPSFFGAFAAAALPFAVVALRGRWRPLVFSTAVSAGILVSFSIAGWLSAAVGIGVLLIASLKGERALLLGRIASASLVAICIVYVLVPGLPRAAVALIDKGSIASTTVVVLPGSSPRPIGDRGRGGEPPEAAEISASERVATTQAAIRMFTSSPLIGVGPGNFGFRYNEFRSSGTAPADQLLIANNIYAELLAETGIIGFCAFLAGYAALVALGVKARVRATGSQARDLAAGLASLAAIATGYLTGPSFTILYQWALIGLVAALIVRQREEPGPT